MKLMRTVLFLLLICTLSYGTQIEGALGFSFNAIDSSGILDSSYASSGYENIKSMNEFRNFSNYNFYYVNLMKLPFKVAGSNIVKVYMTPVSRSIFKIELLFEEDKKSVVERNFNLIKEIISRKYGTVESLQSFMQRFEKTIVDVNVSAFLLANEDTGMFSLIYTNNKLVDKMKTESLEVRKSHSLEIENDIIKAMEVL